ncbi:hypothetical protein HNO88_001329 [Novosphingobium chloroacetimidivorans]|uniref:Uncharacterized protein n=1 Tax=Novosphingobium chloroacetimidivorans TaxID=1428314 RepID=A0A7W7K8M9_9SPHN|nr:hypothetical protein [Novosphingobium chloroacetimidivorans]MBB4858015.1 hypothetical protein [Novosphingobium chloroacetimidivorans]
MIVALALALSTPAEIAAWDGVPVPDEAATPYVDYMGCVSDPVLDVMEAGREQTPAERDAMMTATLAGCRPLRATTAAAMDAKLAHKPDWTDPVVRRARIERILDAMEQRVGFTARDPQGFQAMVQTMRQCIDAGRKDCEPVPPTPSRPN